MRPHQPLAIVAIIAVAAALAGTAVSAPGGIAAKCQQIAELDRRLSAVDAAAGAAAAAHNGALDRRDAVAARIDRTRVDVRRTTSQLARSRALLRGRIVAIYVEGSPSLVEVLLQTGSLADAVAIGDLLGRTAEADAEVVAQVRQRRRALEILRRRLAADAVVARRELAEAESQRRRLEALLDARRARSAATSLAPSRAAAPTAPSAAATGSGATGPVPGGSHVYPLAGASTFGDDWLASRPGGRYHEGIDLFAARGTPVVAVADGTLFRVGHSGISGNRLWLRDAAGTEFFYAHLDGYSAAAREGATVSKGTVLGYNGDTGDARGTSPHVHFEIHPGGGGPVRPYAIVVGWPRVG